MTDTLLIHEYGSRVLQADGWQRPVLPDTATLDCGNAVCAREGHDWCAVGLHSHGRVETPCKRVGCEAALVQYPDGRSFVQTWGFGMAVGDTVLDLADDPDGPVVKMVVREIAESYRLPDVALAAGAVVVDIGAHVGGPSIYLAKRFPKARIIALEPSAANFARLQRNIAANKVHNVIAVHSAVTGDGRDVLLAGNPALATGGYSILKTDTQREIVPSLALADIFRLYGIDRIALLKVDCEGAEYEILEAAGDLLARVELLVGEFHHSDALAAEGRTPDGLAQMVWQHIPRERTRINGSVMV